MTQTKDQTPDKPPIFMKCRNPKCDSIEAIEIPYVAGTRFYRCIKCKNSFAVQVGGKMDIRQL